MMYQFWVSHPQWGRKQVKVYAYGDTLLQAQQDCTNKLWDLFLQGGFTLNSQRRTWKDTYLLYWRPWRWLDYR